MNTPATAPALAEIIERAKVALDPDAGMLQMERTDGIHTAIAVKDLCALLAAVSAAPDERFDMHAHLQRQAEWSARTFGPGARLKGVVDHIRKELVEIEESSGDLKEWVDVVILALDGCWRSGASPSQVIDAIVAKQTKNEGRVWPDWRTADPDKAIEHDRAAVESPDERVRVLEAENARLRSALANLVDTPALSEIRSMVAGWNGEGKPGTEHPRHPPRLGATIRTNCGRVYVLDERMQEARATLVKP